MNERLNRFGKLILGLGIFALVICGQLNAQINKATSFPDRIVLNLTENASNSMAVSWRTNTEISEGYCELQILSGTRINPADSKSFKAITSSHEFTSESEPTINCNHHTFTFKGLMPGDKYLYRVGTKEYWSEWLEFSTADDNSNEFSFLYFGDPQNDIKSQWSRMIRRAYKLETYITDSHFDKLGKFLVLTCAIYLYFNINEYLIPEFTSKKEEITHLNHLFSGEYAPLFWFVIIGGLVLPIIILLFKKGRKPRSMFLVGLLVVLGSWWKRFLIVTLVFLSTAVSFAQENGSSLDWLTNLEEAEKISKQTSKPILMYFTGSDWCPPCVALKNDFFESPEFATRADRFVLVMIDYPRRIDIISEEQLAYNKKVIGKYNSNKSFPKLLVLNHSGKELGRLSGYSSYSTDQDTSYHFEFVDKFSRK